jgi:hypothetical protein
MNGVGASRVGTVSSWQSGGAFEQRPLQGLWHLAVRNPVAGRPEEGADDE